METIIDVELGSGLSLPQAVRLNSIRPVRLSSFWTEGIDSLLTTVAAPILAEGDLLGLVLFISSDPAAVTGDTEYKLAQTIAAFLGRHMES